MSFLNKFRLSNIIEEYVRSHRNDFVFIDQEHINKLQKFYLCMLEDLVPIFEAEGIKICLGGGSLLGKIRHNGFIPWDDDIDVAVFRDDFTKLNITVRRSRLSGGGGATCPDFRSHPA